MKKELTAKEKKDKKTEIIVLLVMFILFSSFVLGNIFIKAEKQDTEFDTAIIIVRLGDTLSSIAETYCEGHNRRDTIADIVRINDMTSTMIYAGQELIIPIYKE